MKKEWGLRRFALIGRKRLPEGIRDDLSSEKSRGPQGRGLRPRLFFFRDGYVHAPIVSGFWRHGATSPVDQSTFAPDTLTTCAHFFVSAAIKRANSAGGWPPGIAPCDNSRSLKVGDSKALAVSC